jgi:activator of HSP90 ATPase
MSLRRFLHHALISDEIILDPCGDLMAREQKMVDPMFNWTTRRKIISRGAMAIGSLVTSSKLLAMPLQQSSKEAPSTSANEKRTALHQEIELKASPKRIYEILLDSKQFAAVTGMPAEIDPKAGGALTMFGGLIVGRNVEIVPNQRIVQAWRPTHWDPGVYSVVKFELKSQAPGTLLVLDHTGFPEGSYDSLSSGWYSHYWEPLKKSFA